MAGLPRTDFPSSMAIDIDFFLETVARAVANTRTPVVDLIAVEGGENRGNPCHSGYHQFLGIEATVTQQIADWIKRYQSTGKAGAGS